MIAAIRSAGLPALLLVPAACGDSSGTGPSYETFSSVAMVTSNLGGPVLRSSDAGNEIIQVTGTYQHDTGRTVLDLGNYTLIDPDGFGDSDGDGLLELSDGTVTVEVLPGYDGFDYATFFGDGFYTAGGTDFLANGIFGIITEAGDMPSSGAGSYSGVGSAILVDSGSDDVTEQTATATVNANFASGLADVDLIFDDTAVDGEDNPVPPAIDRLSVTDMAIAGNLFSGGTIVADYDDALAADPVGTVSGQRADGAFFGFDGPAGIPAEVGGTLLIEGSAGTVAAGFLAD